MAVMTGVPIRLAIGDGDPIEIATLDIPVRVDGSMVHVRTPEASTALAVALRAAADVLDGITEQE